ncbi:thiamine kinase [Yersinia hibernica]|uniref:Thiamine kinase n=1 Tax=Yersinia enterocolitica LC20 TaxID=1443113 RepID=A0A7U4GG98_YEREN|nr:thiamine kinase [Yersinia hibernica]AHM74582.1 thiamine kinase [Yersinia hibernica]OVZ80857.1 thiamine kinase [Yersinia kristensenii]
MAQSTVDSSLYALLNSIIPALDLADCHISPVSGLTGESWRISHSSNTGPNIEWLAREQSVQKTQLGVDRRREHKLLRHVAGSQLAPTIIAADQHWLVVNWLEGDVVTDGQFIELSGNGQLARLLTRLHHLPASGYRLDLRAQLIRYAGLIDSKRRSPSWWRLQQDFLHRPPPQPVKLAPLHMDIHSGNLLATPTGLKLIDWEYAADGDIALEIAALFCSHTGWRGDSDSAARQQVFLQHYCHNELGYHDIGRLSRQVRQWMPWVDYLMLMWFEVRWQQTGNSEFLQWAAPLRQRFNLSF